MRPLSSATEPDIGSGDFRGPGPDDSDGGNLDRRSRAGADAARCDRGCRWALRGDDPHAVLCFSRACLRADCTKTGTGHRLDRIHTRTLPGSPEKTAALERMEMSTAAQMEAAKSFLELAAIPDVEARRRSLAARKDQWKLDTIVE